MKRSAIMFLLMVLVGCDKKMPIDPTLRYTGRRGQAPSSPKAKKPKSQADEAVRRTEKNLPENLSPNVREAVLKFVRAIVSKDIPVYREQYAIVSSFEATKYAVPGLMIALEDRETRSTALAFLRIVGRDAEAVIPTLIDLYISQNYSRVLDTLQWLGPDSVTALAQLLKSDVGNIRAKGVNGIKKIATHVAGQSRLAGRYSEAERTLLILIEAEQHKPDRRLRAATIHFLAVIYFDQARYAEAESQCEEALGVVEALEPKDLHLTALISNCRGNLHTRLGRYSEAEELFKHALESWKKAHGKNNPHTAVALNNLGTLYRYQGRFAEAQAAMDRALEIWRFDFGFGSVWTPRVLANLGALSLARQEYDEAELLLSESLMLCEARLGKEHPDVASTLTHQAKLADKQDLLAEFEQAALRALEIRQMVYGPKHPDVARSQVLLAVAYARRGRLTPAAQLLQEGRAALEQSVGIELVQDAELLQRAEELIKSNPSEISSDRP